jgi:3-oxoacyl-[acyl-carrier protein] reductase
MLLVHNTAPFRLIRAAAPYMRDAAKQEIETSGKAAPRSIINVRSAPPRRSVSPEEAVASLRF